MANKVEEKAMEIADVIAAEQGVYVVGTEYKKEGGERFLRVYIEKEAGVGIDDCELFSRAFSDAIDADDPTDGAYCLEVSSPGAQRHLVTEREFLYYLGREVEVKLYKAADGEKEFVGVLEDFRDKTAYIRYGEKLLQIKQQEAVYIRLFLKL